MKILVTLLFLGLVLGLTAPSAGNEDDDFAQQLKSAAARFALDVPNGEKRAVKQDFALKLDEALQPEYRCTRDHGLYFQRKSFIGWSVTGPAFKDYPVNLLWPTTKNRIKRRLEDLGAGDPVTWRQFFDCR